MSGTGVRYLWFAAVVVVWGAFAAGATLIAQAPATGSVTFSRDVEWLIGSS